MSLFYMEFFTISVNIVSNLVALLSETLELWALWPVSVLRSGSTAVPNRNLREITVVADALWWCGVDALTVLITSWVLVLVWALFGVFIVQCFRIKQDYVFRRRVLAHLEFGYVVRRLLVDEDADRACGICYRRCIHRQNLYRVVRPTLCCRQSFCLECLIRWAWNREDCPVCRAPLIEMYGMDDLWTLEVMHHIGDPEQEAQELRRRDGLREAERRVAEDDDDDEMPELEPLRDQAFGRPENAGDLEGEEDEIPLEPILEGFLDDDYEFQEEPGLLSEIWTWCAFHVHVPWVDLFVDNVEDVVGFEEVHDIGHLADGEHNEGIVDHNASRDVTTTYEEVDVPDLDFTGIHADIFIRDGGEPPDLGIYWNTGSTKCVRLPSTILDELRVFWVGREFTMADYLACVAVTKTWLRKLSISAADQAVAAEVAPFLSMHKAIMLRASLRRYMVGSFVDSVWLCVGFAAGILLITVLVWPFSYLRQYELLSRMEVVNQKHFFDGWWFVASGVATMWNYLADAAVIHRVVLDCEYWRLPLTSVFHVCETDVRSYENVYLCLFLLETILFIFSVLYVWNRKIAVLTLLEDFLRFSVIWFTGIPAFGFVIGVIEFLIHRRVLSLVFHALSCCVGIHMPIFCAVHLFWNVHFPRARFNVFEGLSYYLSNVSVPDVELREKGSMVMPSFVDTNKRGHRRKSQRLYGIGSGGYRPVAYAPNLDNEEAAVKARILAATPKPNSGRVGACVAWVKKNIRKFFPRISRVFSVSFDVYLRRSNASASVKRQLRRTWAKLQAEGIDEDTFLSPTELYKWTMRKSFVKVENNVYRTLGGRKRKASRLIQGATPEFICLVGPWMMAFQDMVKSCWCAGNFLCFTSGVSSLACGKLIDRNGWKILEDDIGAFDASVDSDWLKLELWVFRFFGCPRAVYMLIKANIDTHGVTSKGIRYRREGMRKSGDPYTSVGNSMLNVFMHIFIYCDATEQQFWEAKGNCVMLAQGDDNLMRYSSDVDIDWVARMLEFGFTSEAVFRDNLYEAEFCSNLIYESDQGLTFAPKPGKVMAKLGYYINPPLNVSPESIVRGTALGLYRACNHVAPLRAYLDRLIELTAGVDAWKAPLEEWKMKYDLVEEVPATSITLDRRYGLWSGACQAEFVKGLSEANLGEEFSHPLFDLLCDRDTSGPRCVYIGEIAA